MSATEGVNIASLKIVQSELLATIEESATLIEQFAADRKNNELLQRCVDGVSQIRGVLNLIELRGVNLLADELVNHLKELTNTDDEKVTKKLELISAAFFLLPRYLEYCLQTSRNLGELLLPHINELRQARRVPLLPESYYFQFDLLDVIRSVAVEPIEADAVLVRRLRFMYQTGFLKVLQGTQLKASLAIMSRALQRLESVCATHKMGSFWWVAHAVLVLVSRSHLKLNKSRKMLFSAIDREIKKLDVDGQLVLSNAPPENLLKELLYLLALSKSNAENVQEIISAYHVPLLNYSDAELVREMEFLHGPSTNTINSMVSLLTDEINSTKILLETSAQSLAELTENSPELISSLSKIAEILSMIGLVAPSKSLKQEIEKLKGWQHDNNTHVPMELVSVADTLLYVESTVAGFAKTNMSDDKLIKINALTRDDAMASNQLAEAEKLVVDEAETAIAIVKRALSAFVESNYDRAHIATISATLDGIRGGMFVLSLPRVAKVLASCILFIDQSLLFSEKPAATRRLLETFADAIISLEYYLDSLKLDKNADADVLRIAEESLEALGYKV